MSLADSFEKIPVSIFQKDTDAAVHIAREMAELIRSKQKEGKNCILGLATGSSPIKVYEELVRMHKEDGLSFRNVITFNLDEYYPMKKENHHSYHHFMHEHLFNHIDIKPENINIPDGTIPIDALKQYCIDYENKIEEAGGIDYQILGIGLNGHIGFNEPGSGRHSMTRLVALDNTTRLANAYEFSSISQVPRLAITVGINTILKAKRIVLLAWGSRKAPVIYQSVEGKVTDLVPASFLQEHQNCTFVLDEGAAQDL
ncbi:MAG: glucosamine-6-phosphate deaminase, partial [Chitinophagaceae bacterium]